MESYHEEDDMAAILAVPVCMHHTIMEETCLECGATMVAPHATTPLLQQISSINFQRFNIPNQVRERASQIASQLKALNGPTKFRPAQICLFCVYSAYRELGFTIEVRDVVVKLGITNCELLDYISTGYQPRMTVTTVEDILLLLCTELGCSSQMYEQLCAITKALVTKHPQLRDSTPKKTAAAIFQCYVQEVKPQCNTQRKISDVIEITDSTISIMTASIKGVVLTHLNQQ